MQISVSASHIDIGDNLRAHAASVLNATVDRHFGGAIEGKVVFARVRHLFRADISVHVARAMVVQSHGEAGDAYGAFDAAAERLDARLRRYKGRLVDRHKGRASAGEPEGEAAVEVAAHYILDADPANAGEDPENGCPPVIAESLADIAVLTPAAAVMRLDLTDQPVLMFRNRAHGGLNVVYRHRDGTIGWIDPASALPSASPTKIAGKRR